MDEMRVQEDPTSLTLQQVVPQIVEAIDLSRTTALDSMNALHRKVDVMVNNPRDNSQLSSNIVNAVVQQLNQSIRNVLSNALRTFPPAPQEHSDSNEGAHSN